MTIDDAIKIKVQWRKDNYPPALADEMNADKLSIEALKRLQHSRRFGGQDLSLQLTGETEE